MGLKSFVQFYLLGSYVRLECLEVSVLYACIPQLYIMQPSCQVISIVWFKLKKLLHDLSTASVNEDVEHSLSNV